MTLSIKTRFTFGVGHVLNDLCASMWFSYLLVFFHKVLQFTNATAGYVLLAGQVADGIATPLVGYESDRRGNLCNYGRRKTWHLIGTISVALSFPLLFMRCIGCEQNTPEYAQFIYYVPLVVIFQCGWAATQINHLALIPELGRNTEEKINLNAIRYAFTVLSNIMVYVTTWIVFDLGSGGADQLGPSDLSEFRNIAIVVVAVGAVFSLIFHIGVKENNIQQRFNSHGINANHSQDSISSSEEQSITTNGAANEKTPLLGNGKTVVSPASEDSCHVPMMKWSDWFRRASFYQMAIMYMCTRLVVNLSQVYLPMYLTDTLKLSKNYIALVPLVVYISGFIAAILTKPLSKFLRNEIIYLLGAMLVLGACTWSHFLQADASETSRNIFFLAVILGLGTTIILVMCLSMLSELVGDNTETGAFVYGAMSLTDKISNGIAIAVIQNMNPCACNCDKCVGFFHFVMSWVIIIIMGLGMIATIFFSVTMKTTRPVQERVTSVDPDTQSNGSINA